MGAAGLEPANPEGEGFTVPCDCHYATPPKRIAGERSRTLDRPITSRMLYQLSYTSKERKHLSKGIFFLQHFLTHFIKFPLWNFFSEAR